MRKAFPVIYGNVCYFSVIYNNWAINRDEKIFPEPKAFKPDRWLTEDGKLNKELLKSFFPFGVGECILS